MAYALRRGEDLQAGRIPLLDNQRTREKACGNAHSGGRRAEPAVAGKIPGNKERILRKISPGMEGYTRRMPFLDVIPGA